MNDSQLMDIIRRHYLDILKREPDQMGMEFYLNKIKNKEIPLESLKSIFENSLEYIHLQEEKKELEKIIKPLNASRQKNVLQKSFEEPDLIFISLFQNTTNNGGIFILRDEKLNPILEDTGFYGAFFDKVNQVLFCITRKEPQIIAFKVNKEKFTRIPINFSNYVFASDAHGVHILQDKIFIVASDGEPNAALATNTDGPSNLVGKIIISDIEFGENRITVKNSKLFNPFNCNHHHHINDLCDFEGELYMTSFSYCDSSKNYVKSGTISKMKFENSGANVISDGLEQPHSITSFRDKLYVCSSAAATILSIDPEEKKLRLEYKGVNGYTRGLLVTENYFYVGISESIGRTNSKFNNTVSGLLKFNRRTGETMRISLPENYDNIYTITSN